MSDTGPQEAPFTVSYPKHKEERKKSRNKVLKICSQFPIVTNLLKTQTSSFISCVTNDILKTWSVFFLRAIYKEYTKNGAPQHLTIIVT